MNVILRHIGIMLIIHCPRMFENKTVLEFLPREFCCQNVLSLKTIMIKSSVYIYINLHDSIEVYYIIRASHMRSSIYALETKIPQPFKNLYSLDSFLEHYDSRS